MSKDSGVNRSAYGGGLVKFGADVILCTVAKQPSRCALAIVEAGALANPGISQQVANDPYYIHMPKNDPVEEVRYSMQMGGEDHDPSMCELI